MSDWCAAPENFFGIAVISANETHLLVAVLGRTPQIITETLYALCVQGHIPIERVIILTTAEGRKQAQHALLDGPSWLQRLVGDYPDSFPHLDISQTKIISPKRDGAELKDIRDTRDNELLVEMMLATMRALTRDENVVLHCSLAGGRKTMSVYLALALQFFARPCDKLYHVLVSPPELEGLSEFFYPPPEIKILKTRGDQQISTEQAKVELLEVPFVRLRNQIEMLFGDAGLSFADMVARAQAEIEQLPHLPPLVIDRQRRVLRIGKVEIYLPPKEFALYLFCAERNLARPESAKPADADAYFEPVRNGDFYGEATVERLLHLYAEVRGGRNPDIRSFQNTQEVISKIRSKLEAALSDTDLVPYYAITSVGPYAAKKYGIRLDKSRIKIR